jgi:hypothetical protein
VFCYHHRPFAAAAAEGERLWSRERERDGEREERKQEEDEGKGGREHQSGGKRAETAFLISFLFDLFLFLLLLVCFIEQESKGEKKNLTDWLNVAWRAARWRQKQLVHAVVSMAFIGTRSELTLCI